MRIIDNKSNLLQDRLIELIDKNSCIYISTDYFTVYGLFSIAETCAKAKEIKLLVNFSEEKQTFLQDENENKLNFELDRKYRTLNVQQLIADKIQVRQGGIGNQNLIIIENERKTSVLLLTPLNLNAVSTGEVSSTFPCFINEFQDEQKQYLQLFNQAWENTNNDLKNRFKTYYNHPIQKFSPRDVYKYTIRQIFSHTTIDERAEKKLEKSGFKDAKIWSMLFNFQKDAVIGAIDKIETYGGCIIADSVGLGKTFEALAVMKYYQLRNSRILVLAPKKLRDNWTLYKTNDKRNILAKDRFNYDVLNHTDLSRESGMSGDIDLETINWGNYDLVVIDESHNFRNNPNKKGTTRYKRLMNDVIRANIRTKVLMLSATPVNNKLNDLKNQIAFITEGNDTAFTEFGILSIASVMRETQSKFNKWVREGHAVEMDVEALLATLDGAYFKILDMITIARSRKHIEKYYDTSEIGKFPERCKPKTIEAEIDTQNKIRDIAHIYDEISLLSLASYTPLSYVRAEKMPFYEDKYDMRTGTGSIFKQIDREQSLIYLMRVNLLKRLESSVHSFRLTLQKLINLIEHNLSVIDNSLVQDVDLDLNITDIELDDTDLEDLLVGGKTKVLVQDIDSIRWRQDLESDLRILNQLMGTIQLITTDRDAKLKELKELISEKVNNPINPGNKKVIVFTAFADTATYLYENIANWAQTELKVNVALVTGSNANKTNLKNSKADLHTILTNFSPVSKKRDETDPKAKEEIDLLICTDCISEGQNLQDCDYLVNYDIHWNPVRIIQRFGRIDRIGSTNQKIQLVNFYPNMELDSFIELIAKVKGRMVMLDVSASGEENIIRRNSKEMQDLDYRKKQLKKLQEQVIDLEDVEGNISITDLTFNDFKIDIEKSANEELQRIDKVPVASYAVVKSSMPQIKEGVIFCFKENTVKLKNHPREHLLYPYYLVYVSMDGAEVLKAKDTKKILDYFRKLGMGQQTTDTEAWAMYNNETKNDKFTGKYKHLIQLALNALKGQQQEIGLDALAMPGVEDFVNLSTQSDENISLVSYLIIK